MITDALFRLRITLRGIDPPIWRLVDVAADIPMYYLHYVLQQAMGWSHSHQYNFSHQSRYDPGATSRFLAVGDPRFIPLNDVAAPGDSMVYEYDFTDRWQHDIVIEAERERDGNRYPRLVAGGRACPPERVGGPAGYAALLNGVDDPDYPDHETIRMRMGETFDPEAVDLDFANRWMPRGVDLVDERSATGVPLFDIRPPVSHLMMLGEPEWNADEWPDYQERGIRAAHVPELVLMLNDKSFNWIEGNDEPFMWAPIHAWRAIGQLRDLGAVPDLLRMLLERDVDDWMINEVPEVLAMMGLDVVPMLTELFQDRTKGIWARCACSDALILLVEAHPELRVSVTAILVEELFQEEGNDPEFNANLVGDLAALRALEALPGIERMMQADEVDELLVGDWEDVQIEFGVLEKRITPRRSVNDHWKELLGMPVEGLDRELRARLERDNDAQRDGTDDDDD